MRDEIGEHPVDLAGGDGRPSSVEPAFDHAAGAAADHGARLVVGDRRQPLAREHDVEGVDQVGRGVDQRAVEVEDDGQVRPCFSAILEACKRG